MGSTNNFNRFTEVDNLTQSWLFNVGDAIAFGDLLYDNGSDVARPADKQASQSSEAADQVLFASLFCGVSQQQILSGETNATKRITVRVQGVMDFACPSQTFNKGDLVGIYSDGISSPDPQKLDKVTTIDKAIGCVVKSYLTATTTVRVELIAKKYMNLAAVATNSTFGDIIVASVTSSDSSLDIAAKAGSASVGGSLNLAGGAGSGATNAGGAITGTAGTGVTSGAGGAVTWTGGTGGAGGVGGAVSLTGGAPTSGNAAGGAASLTGGAGSGNAAGGAVTIAAGVAGATGTGGAVTVTGGAGVAGVGGAVTMAGGAGVGTTNNGGAISMTGGAGATGASTGGQASIVGGASGAAGVGGAALITGGACSSGAGTGGAVTITSGAGTATGTAGAVGIDTGAANSGTAGIIKIGDANAVATYLNRGTLKALNIGLTLTALGTTQSSTPTAAQLLGGFLTQTGSTGAGAVTLPSGTALSAAFPRTPATGDSFECVFANLGGSQTLTITGATGTTVVSGGAVATAKTAILKFICTGSNAWSIVVAGG